jgi:hypothetical protein
MKRTGMIENIDTFRKYVIAGTNALVSAHKIEKIGNTLISGDVVKIELILSGNSLSKLAVFESYLEEFEIKEGGGYLLIFEPRGTNEIHLGYSKIDPEKFGNKMVMVSSTKL